jgi:hypothetical protein
MVLGSRRLERNYVADCVARFSSLRYLRSYQRKSAGNNPSILSTSSLLIRYSTDFFKFKKIFRPDSSLRLLKIAAFI